MLLARTRRPRNPTASMANKPAAVPLARCPRWIAAEREVEDAVDLVARDAATRVEHRDERTHTVRTGLDHHGAVARGVADGVVEQVTHHPVELGRGDVDDRRRF